eukprot:jgi/Psemu1/67437/estExt_Genemark1.C_3190023
MAAEGDPGTQHYNMGDTLRFKGFYDDALPELLHAICLLETRFGSKSLQVAATHYSLGLAYRALKEFKQAIKHLNRAKDIYESKKGEKEPDCSKEIENCRLNLARTHHSRGVMYQRNGSYNDSVMEHRKAIALRESILGRSNLETARSYYVLGCALSDRGDFDEALSDLRRALRIRIRVFGKDHLDVVEVVANIGTVMIAKGVAMESVNEYKLLVVRSLEYENEGDIMSRKGELDDAIVYYKKALSLEMQYLGDLHPTTCDLYLRLAETLSEGGDLEGSLVEYKSALAIYERLMGKFHVKMADIYSRLAGVLMDKGEYETALSFYAKAYGIYDGTLGLHDDTKQALMNVKLAAEKNRAAKSSMEILVKAEEEFKKRHPQFTATPISDSEDELKDSDDDEGGSNGQEKKKKKKKKKKRKDKKGKDKQFDSEEEMDII